MSLFLAGLALFLGVHCVSIAAPAWRKAWIARRGDAAWKGLYSLVAGLGLVLLVIGYGMARRDPVVLYTPPLALRHVAWLLMLPVFPLLFAAYLPGRIRTVARHPMLLAVTLWATAHLLANGTLVDVILFASFLVWAIVDRISVKRRSVVDAHAVPAAPARPINDAVAVVGGLLSYAVIVLWAHRWLIGVSPFG